MTQDTEGQMPPQQEIQKNNAPKGLLEKTHGLIKGNVENTVKIRNKKYDYESAATTYGFTLRERTDGTMFFDPSGAANKVDRIGDFLLRIADDHTVKEPGKLFRRHPKWFLQRLATGPKRSRGEAASVVANADRLGLSEYYGLSPDGIEVKKPEIFTQGINLQDIYRGDNEALTEIDRTEALTKAGEYIHQIHANHGAIGEIHTTDIIFQEKEGSHVNKPVLNLPDIIYNTSKYTPEQLRTLAEPRAVDMLDFLMVVGTEELRKTTEWESVQKAIGAVLTGYGDTKVIEATSSLAKRGRLTFVGDEAMLNLPDTVTTKVRPVTSQHNKARLAVEKDIAPQLRQMVVDTCSSFVQSHQPDQGFQAS